MTNNMSFYGGRPGKPFVITKVFNTYGELQNDANMGWSSTIPIGDYVIIGYKYNGEISAEQDKAYGGTLWQKVYRDISADAVPINYETNSGEIEINGRLHYFANNQPGGIGYKFISETGNTPEISLEHEVVAPNKQPEIEAIYKNHGGAKYNFKLPRSANYYYFEYIKGLSLINGNGGIESEIIINNLIEVVLDDKNSIKNITREEYLGDYFIEKNVGLVYKVEEVYSEEKKTNELMLVFKTRLTASPEPVTNWSDYANGGVLNQPKIDLVITQGIDTQLKNNYQFTLPKNPDIKFNINFNANPETYVDKQINNNDIDYTINFPVELKGISNFNIKYITDDIEKLPITQSYYNSEIKRLSKKLEADIEAVNEEYKDNESERSTRITNLRLEFESSKQDLENKIDDNLRFANLALVGPDENDEKNYTLYIYNNENRWTQIGETGAIQFNTGNSVEKIKLSTAIRDEEITDKDTTSNELNYYNIKIMNEMLSWNGNNPYGERGIPKFLSVSEGPTEPDKVDGQLYINTTNQELYYEGKPIIQKTQDAIISNDSKPINSKAVEHLEGIYLYFNLPNTAEWKQDENDTTLWKTTISKKDVSTDEIKKVSKVVQWLSKDKIRTPIFSFIKNDNEEINLDRQQQFDKISYIDIRPGDNSLDNSVVNIEIGVYTKNKILPISTKENVLPLVGMLFGGTGVSI